MGIDAEMFVRIRGKENWLTAEQALRKAYELASTLGHEHFFILRPGEFDEAPRHCLAIVEPYDGEYGDEDLIGKRIVFQDGPPIIAADDEQFIRVYLWTRYYGPGYERGDWPAIRATAEWCEFNLPGEVWYGGDSSGVVHSRFGVEERAAFNEHYLRNGRRPYVHRRGIDGRFDVECPICKVGMFESGWGGGPQGFTLFRCDGCGQQAVKDAERMEWFGPREEDAMSKFRAATQPS